MKQRQAFDLYLAEDKDSSIEKKPSNSPEANTPTADNVSGGFGGSFAGGGWGVSGFADGSTPKADTATTPSVSTPNVAPSNTTKRRTNPNLSYAFEQYADTANATPAVETPAKNFSIMDTTPEALKSLMDNLPDSERGSFILGLTNNGYTQDQVNEMLNYYGYDSNAIKQSWARPETPASTGTGTDTGTGTGTGSSYFPVTPVTPTSAYNSWLDGIHEQQKQSAATERDTSINGLWNTYLQSVNPQGAMAEVMRESGYSKTGGAYNNQLGRSNASFQNSKAGILNAYEQTVANSKMAIDQQKATAQLEADRTADARAYAASQEAESKAQANQSALRSVAQSGASDETIAAYAKSLGITDYSNALAVASAARADSEANSAKATAAQNTDDFIAFASSGATETQIRNAASMYGITDENVINTAINIANEQAETAAKETSASYALDFKNKINSGAVSLDDIELSKSFMNDEDYNSVIDYYHKRASEVTFYMDNGKLASYDLAKEALAEIQADTTLTDTQKAFYQEQFNKSYADKIAKEEKAKAEEEEEARKEASNRDNKLKEQASKNGIYTSPNGIQYALGDAVGGFTSSLLGLPKSAEEGKTRIINSGNAGTQNVIFHNGKWYFFDNTDILNGNNS